MPDDHDELRVRCVCGWEVTGPRSHVLSATRDHGRRIHNMEAGDDEIMAMAGPADDALRGTAT